MTARATLVVLALAGCNVVFGLDELPPPTNPLPEGDWSAVAASERHTCAIRLDGTLWCWGDNRDGQLGIANAVTLAAPTAVSDGRWRSITSDRFTTCGIQTDDSLWCWGRTSSGQVGNNAITPTPALPFRHAGSWSTVATGLETTCAIAADAALWCWGETDFDPGSTIVAPVPVMIDPGPWSAIDVAEDHACGIRGGELWCWGNASLLGDPGIVAHQPAPIRIGPDRWRAIAASTTHTCAIREDGSAWCWGDNAEGQLGNGTRSPTATTQPGRAGAASERYTAISTGDRATCALRESGELACWGDNRVGQLATPQLTTGLLEPTPISHPTTWSQLSLGDSHTCGVDADARLWCSGGRDHGQLGDGRGNASRPAKVPDKWLTVAANNGSTCAHDDLLRAHCWGFGRDGAIGNGTLISQQTPQQAGPEGGFTIGVGASHVCEQRGDETFCWGQNASGQLGNGSEVAALTPTQVPGTPPDLYAFTGGLDHTCALAGNTAYCWGDNMQNQIGGDAIGLEVLRPMMVPGEYISIAAGWDFTCAIRSDHLLTCTGNVNNAGTIIDLATPIAFDVNPVKVFAGRTHSCVLGETSVAGCWGDNSRGQLGVLDVASAPTPQRLTNTWAALAVGGAHTCGIDLDRTLWCWGENDAGQVGNGTLAPQPTPMQIDATSRWAAIAAGASHTCALDTNDDLWCWGSNTSGQLGDGNAWRFAFVVVP